LFHVAVHEVVPMTWQAGVVLVMSLGLPVLVATCLFRVIPAANRSLYRYDLWRMRDELVDALRAGALPRKHEAVRHLVVALDAAIRLSSRLSLLRMFVLYRTLRAKTDLPLPPSTVGMSEPEVQLFNEFVSRLTHRTIHHLFVSSPSGWLAILLFEPFYLADRIRHRRDSKKHVRESARLIRRSVDMELFQTPTVILAAHNIDTSEMSALSGCAG
jgi:hypothetical protein